MPANNYGSEFVPSRREKPISHPGMDAPLCQKCKLLELSFFDPGCPGCSSILINSNTTIPELFAILRQWVPQTQQNIQVFIKEILKRGAHVNDRDGLTDMTMLHYAAKAGAVGVGDVSQANEAVQDLIEMGADFSQKCRWTDMLPLHYATFFDVAPTIHTLLNASGGSDADCPCKEFENGSPLHIACANLCYKAAKCLLEHKANPNVKNALGKTPRECLPQVSSNDASFEVQSTIQKMHSCFLEAEASAKRKGFEGLNEATLQALQLSVGDQVTVSGKVGTLEYCGPTDFASGQWAGVALNEPDGKNDGSVGGVRYFNCERKHGIFAPLSRIKKHGISPMEPLSRPPSFQSSSTETSEEHSSQEIRQKSVSPKEELDGDVRNVSQKLEKSNLKDDNKQIPQPIRRGGSKIAKKTDDSIFHLKNGMSVYVNNELGILRYIGSVDFASGIWLGVELRKPSGKNDGSVEDRRYFTCKQNYGLMVRPSRATCRGINCAQLLPAFGHAYKISATYPNPTEGHLPLLYGIHQILLLYDCVNELMKSQERRPLS